MTTSTRFKRRGCAVVFSTDVEHPEKKYSKSEDPVGL
jgi:hypothetical protein